MNSGVGIPGVAIKRGQVTGPFNYDTSGTAYIPSGEASVTVACGELNQDSVVLVHVIAVTTETDPICEISASRTYGDNGTFVVGTQTAATVGADVYFNWAVMRV
jgi:hypothetical protein